MLQFHNSSYLFSLLPLWVQAGPALPGQSVPGLTDMKGSIASSRGGATGCPTDPWIFPPFGGHNPGCPHRGDRGRGVYQQALMVSSFSHMQITTSRQKRPRGRQKKGEVVGDNAGWDCWKNCCGRTIPSSSGGNPSLTSAPGAGWGVLLYPQSCWTAGDEQAGAGAYLYSAFLVLWV